MTPSAQPESVSSVEAIDILAKSHVPAFYEAFPTQIDLVLFTVVFTACVLLLWRLRFGSAKPPRLIILGIGLSLGLVLIAAQVLIGFSLLRSAPLMVIMVGPALYYLLYTLGFSGITSICASYIVTFLLVQIISPATATHLHQRMLFLASALALLFLFSVVGLFWKTLSFVWLRRRII